MHNDRWLPSMWVCALYSAIASGLIFLGLTIWQHDAQETTPEAVTRARDDFHRTIDNLASGNRTSVESSPPSIPWAAEHPLMVALIAFVVLCCACRLYLFMRRLEDR